MSGNVNRWGRSQAAGFTILELIVVIGIMVFLAVTLTLVLPFIMKQVALKKARVDMSRLALVLELYKLEMGRYPITDNIDDVVADLTKPSEGWDEASTRHLAGIKFSVTKWKDTGLELEPEEWKLADPWGRPYVYCHFLRYDERGTAMPPFYKKDLDGDGVLDGIYHCAGGFQLISSGPNRHFLTRAVARGLFGDQVDGLDSYSGTAESHLRGLDPDDLNNFWGL